MKKRYLLIGAVMLFMMSFAQAPEGNLTDSVIKKLMINSYTIGYNKGFNEANTPEEHRGTLNEGIRDFMSTADAMIIQKKNKLNK